MKQSLLTYCTTIFAVCSFFLETSHAQSDSLSNAREVVIHNQADSFLLSAFTVITQSFRINHTSAEVVPSEGQDYILAGSYFIWKDDSPVRKSSKKDSFAVSFRVLPYQLDRWTSRFDSVIYRDGAMQVMQPIRVDPFVGNEPLIAEPGIQYDGTFSRGLSLGNRQDLVLNSNFDLRLAGNLASDIEILAALSDNSIPLQPEGNTQQLQEFDKIFIQLSKGGSKLIGGDYILDRPKSYFINYYKRLQGVRVENETKLNNGARVVSAAGVGSTRGQFARITIDTREGNQGPYRLEGKNNERFLIVLANSERIYLDGKLLIRGLEKDYTIDYNAGEITFTPNRIITKDSRVIAEYEYSDQNYNRSIFTVETGIYHEKFDLQFNAYSEQDAKLSSGFLDLNAEDKRFLAELGDSTQDAFAPSVKLRPEGYDENIVMYKLIDTLGYRDVLVRSINPDSARYTARFTFFGEGNGDYIAVSEDANGAVYAWIAPDLATGASQGAYQPVTQLVAPKQQQMFSLGGQYRLGKAGQITSEVSVSRNDQNRFSDLDKEDDYGYAVTNGYAQTFDMTKDESNPWQLHTELRHEYLSNTFEILKPYRNQEFVRDWNLQNLEKSQEHLAHGLMSLKSNHLEIAYRYGGFFKDELYNGHKHVVTGGFQKGGFALNLQGDRLKSQSLDAVSTFFRPNLNIAQSFGKDEGWTLGMYFEEEKNQRRILQTDTLAAGSFYYDLGRLYLQRTAGENLDFEVSYQKRFDYLAEGEDFSLSTNADDYSVRGRWNADSKSVLDATLTIRNLDIVIPSAVAQEGGVSYLGRINHKFNIVKSSLRTSTSYEVSSGQEPKRTFQYLKVNAGQGVYTWIDLNEDGIQQINEFEIAAFPEQAEYIRVNILSNEFIATNNILLNQSYSFDPRRLLPDDNFWSKFSDQGTIRIQRKNLQHSGVSLWNPFKINIADSSLVSVSSQIRNVFYFNRSNPAYDIQYEWNDFRNRFVLTTGYESKSLKRHILRSRLNLNRQLSGLLTLTAETDEQDSESFDSKDYLIKSLEFEPELTWQPSNKFRITTNYQFANKKNQLPDTDEKAKIHNLKLEGTFNQVSTSSLRAQLSLVLIDFNGKKNSALEFAMLDGLKDGTNWIWGISYDRKLMNNIRLNISYDGRKSTDSPVVHTARAQVSAFF